MAGANGTDPGTAKTHERKPAKKPALSLFDSLTLAQATN